MTPVFPVLRISWRWNLSESDGYLFPTSWEGMNFLFHHEVPKQSSHHDNRIAVIAIGNPCRGDDGIGVACIKVLANCPHLPSRVDIIDCSGGGFIDALLSQKYEYMLIVDAADMGLQPGAWKFFDINETLFFNNKKGTSITSHYLSLVVILNVIKVLSIKLPQIEILGIQPQSLIWSMEISEQLIDSIPELCQAILEQLIRRNLDNGKDTGS